MGDARQPADFSAFFGVDRLDFGGQFREFTYHLVVFLTGGYNQFREFGPRDRR
jgi:hypothetical protein